MLYICCNISLNAVLIAFQLFPEFGNLPNVHVLQYLVQNARSFGMLLNVNVALKESVHRIFKGYVSHTNKRNLDFDLIKLHNTFQGIRFAMDCSRSYGG